MISDDEYLERIVAGIHDVTTANAEVHWNEVINGRQFDVVVRFTLGTLNYLVLIEVKNRSRKASATDLDAFVSKAGDQKANKAVFVTAAGFQSGAIEVARRHGIDLFTVRFEDNTPRISPDANLMLLIKADAHPHRMPPPTIEVGSQQQVNAIEGLTLTYSDGSRYEAPDESSQMTYYISKIKLEKIGTLNNLLQSFQLPNPDINKVAQARYPIHPPQQITPPDDYYFPKGILTENELLVAGRKARIIRGNVRFEPGLLTLPVTYTNASTGESLSFYIDQLPLGERKVEAGKFYFSTHPLTYYYCDRIEGDTVRWHMIESFQNGSLCRGTMTQNISQSRR